MAAGPGNGCHPSERAAVAIFSRNSVLRSGGIGQPRTLLRSSSGAKSRFVNHVPASMPTTSMPACASGSAATPPAAPRPTMTTSASFSLVATCLRESVVVVRRFVVRLQIVRLEPLLIPAAHHRPHTGICDEIPADEMRVAAVMGISKRALMRVAQHEIEERGGTAGESGGRAFLDIREKRVLIRRRQRGELNASRRTRVLVDSGKTCDVRLTRRGERTPECAVDIMRRTCFTRAGTVLVGRNEPRDDGFEDIHFGCGEILERLARLQREAVSRAAAARLKGSRDGCSEWRNGNAFQQIAARDERHESFTTKRPRASPFNSVAKAC